MPLNEEPLSLATFEPSHAFPPYLTTPRSLEACRRLGVQPIELVEISIDEFRKEFPNDPDAAQRRYERVEGARRRALEDVKAEWNNLVSSGWQPKKSRPRSGREAIINVPCEVHSTLLEIQAEQFRKIEMEEFKSLQRMLYMNLKNADYETKSKQILEKHEEMDQSNDEFRKMVSKKRQDLLQEHFRRMKEKEMREAAELKKLQALTVQEAVDKRERDAERAKREKQHREQLEYERLQREAYTRQLKDSIMESFESKVTAKKQAQQLRDKEVNDRVKEMKDLKHRQDAIRRQQIEERISKAKERIDTEAEQKRLTLTQRIEEDNQKREKLLTSHSRRRSPSLHDDSEEEKDYSKEKLETIQKKKEEILISRVEKVKAELEFKDQLCQRELDKVKEAQEKRRTIKSIRQESFELCAIRRKKAEEHRLAELERQVSIKQQKSEAIRNGYITLQKMKTTMKDIMTKATIDLKEEMHRLQHRDQYSPDAVVKVALNVSDQVLFPLLQKTFKSSSSSSSSHLQSAVTDNNANVSNNSNSNNNNNNKNRAMTAPVNNSNNNNNINNNNSKAVTGEHHFMDLTNNNNNLTDEDFDDVNYNNNVSSGNASSPVLGKGTSPHRGGGASALSGPRRLAPTLGIKTLNRTNLVSSLVESKARAESPEKDRAWDTSDRPRVLKGSAHGGGTSSSGARAKTSQGVSRSTNDLNRGLGRTESSLLAGRSEDGSSLGPLDPTQGGKAFYAMSRDIEVVDDDHTRGRGMGMVSRSSNSLTGGGDSISGPSHLSQSQESLSTRGGGGGGGGGGSQRDKSSHGARSATAAAGAPPGTAGSKTRFLPVKSGEFRRELSGDHPLAGGRGQYKNEIRSGLIPASGARVDAVNDDIDNNNNNNNNSWDSQESAMIAMMMPLSMEGISEHSQREIDAVKKKQNEVLLKILEEERLAEEERENLLKSMTSNRDNGNYDDDIQEKMRLEFIFGEERQRASERIIRITKEHEKNIRQLVLNALNLSKSI